MNRTALYRHFDASGALLYVGVSDCLSHRDRQHSATSAWHDMVKRTETEWCLSRDHALALERVAIQYESPQFNRAMSASSDVVTHRVQTGANKVVSIWPVRADLARAIGVSDITVRAWFNRGSIPAKHDKAIIAAAKAAGHEVTPADLHDLRNAIRQNDEGAAA